MNIKSENALSEEIEAMKSAEEAMERKRKLLQSCLDQPEIVDSCIEWALGELPVPTDDLNIEIWRIWSGSTPGFTPK